MTGTELRQFITDQGWSVTYAATHLFRVDRSTLYRQLEKNVVDAIYAQLVRAYMLMPKSRRAELLATYC